MDEDELIRLALDIAQRRVSTRSAPSLTFRELSVDYLSAHVGSKSLHVMKTRLAPFLATFGDRPVLSLEIVDWSRHAAARIATPIPDAKDGRCYSKNTINMELGWARRLINWGVEQGRVRYNPIAGAKRLKGAKKCRQTAPVESEIGQLLAACTRPQHVVMVLAACDVGMRRSEILQLRHDWIDHETKTVDLPNWACKCNQGGRVPATGRFLEAVLDVPRHIRYPYVIWGERSEDGRVSRETLGYWWRELRRKSGVKAAPGDGEVRLHDGRAAAATNALARGVKLRTVSRRILRHASLRTTEVYLRGDDDLAEATELMELGIERDKIRDEKRKGPKRSNVDFDAAKPTEHLCVKSPT